jgi:hypothetical protein
MVEAVRETVSPIVSSGNSSSRRGFGKRQPSVVSYRTRSPRGNAVSGFAVTSGARDIDSTPPATKRSPSPAITACAAPTIADRPEAQRRLTVTPPTDSGKPASSTAMRATLRLSSPAWFAQPSQTSSICSTGTPARSTAACPPARRRNARPACAPPKESRRGSRHYAADRCSRSMTSRQNAAARAPSTTRWSNVSEMFPTDLTTISPSRTTGRSPMRWMPRMPTSG